MDSIRCQSVPLLASPVLTVALSACWSTALARLAWITVFVTSIEFTGESHAKMLLAGRRLVTWHGPSGLRCERT